MPQNFLSCDRDQPMLLPPDLRDWLSDDHFAWFVIDAVSELDLEPFYASYRTDGHGAAAHDPKMMVTLFVYAYAVGERSSRGIERRCREDVAFRVICANQATDHATPGPGALREGWDRRRRRRRGRRHEARRRGRGRSDPHLRADRRRDHRRGRPHRRRRGRDPRHSPR